MGGCPCREKKCWGNLVYNCVTWNVIHFCNDKNRRKRKMKWRGKQLSKLRRLLKNAKYCVSAIRQGTGKWYYLFLQVSFVHLRFWIFFFQGARASSLRANRRWYHGQWKILGACCETRWHAGIFYVLKAIYSLRFKIYMSYPTTQADLHDEVIRMRQVFIKKKNES